MNGKREKTNAHGAGRILSYEPLKVHCDACDQDFNSWESFGRHVDKIVDKPANTRREAVMDVLADHLGDIGMEDGWDDPQVTPDGSIKCGCLAEFPDITAWRAHLAQTIIDNIDASKEAYEALNRVDVEATREAGEMTASLIVLDAAENRDGNGSDMTCAPSNPTAGTTGNMSE